MASLPGTSLTQSFRHHTVVVFTTAASAITNAVQFITIAISSFANTLRTLTDDFMKLFHRREPMCPPMVEQRFVERSKAPLMFSEPAFVGAGPMLRRWR